MFVLIDEGPGEVSLLPSDLGQLGSADQRVGLLQQPPPGALVVKRAVVSLGVAVAGAEVVTTSKREVSPRQISPHQTADLGPDNHRARANESERKFNTVNISPEESGSFPTDWIAAVGSVAAPNLQHDPI